MLGGSYELSQLQSMSATTLLATLPHMIVVQGSGVALRHWSKVSVRSNLHSFTYDGMRLRWYAGSQALFTMLWIIFGSNRKVIHNNVKRCLQELIAFIPDQF